MFTLKNVCSHKIPLANLNCIYIYSTWTKDIHDVNNSIYQLGSQQPGNKITRNNTPCAVDPQRCPDGGMTKSEGGAHMKT